jgi:hypothetical protein
VPEPYNNTRRTAMTISRPFPVPNPHHVLARMESTGSTISNFSANGTRCRIGGPPRYGPYVACPGQCNFRTSCILPGSSLYVKNTIPRGGQEGVREVQALWLHLNSGFDGVNIVIISTYRARLSLNFRMHLISLIQFPFSSLKTRENLPTSSKRELL